MNLARILTLVVATAVGSTALAARPPGPIVPIRNQPVVTSRAQAPSLADVRAAIARGATVHGWVLSEAKDNSFLATLTLRKHVVAIRITFDTRVFSFDYVSSQNMDYVVSGGVPLIHPKYNQWAANLASDIRAELVKL